MLEECDVAALCKACKTTALAALTRRAGERMRAIRFDIDGHLDVRVEAMDSFARDAPLDARADVNGLVLRRIHFVRLALNNVPSLDHKGAVIGALVVGDSFVSTLTANLSVTSAPTPPLVLTR